MLGDHWEALCVFREEPVWWLQNLEECRLRVHLGAGLRESGDPDNYWVSNHLDGGQAIVGVQPETQSEVWFCCEKFKKPIGVEWRYPSCG